MALMIAAVGCAAASTVIAPDGYPAIYISCAAHRQDRCYIKAERICPYGYQLVAPPYYGGLMIRCQ
jgi:hypothetical protein